MIDLCHILDPISCKTGVFTNWAETYSCRPLSIFEPQTAFQCECIVELGKREGRQLRVAGSGHSPSDLTCTEGFMIKTDRLDQVLEINESEKWVNVQAGAKLHQIHAVLGEHGLAMSNVGSISEQAIAGIICTASHGTGWNFKPMSSSVLELEVLLADGSRVVCSNENNIGLFKATLCGLGATGMILRVKIQVEDAFRLAEKKEAVPFGSVIGDLENIAKSGEHVRLWWYAQADEIHVMRADRTKDAPNPPPHSFFWDRLLGFDALQLMLFLGLYVPSILPSVAQFACWLRRPHGTTVDDSWKIFNLDVFIKQYTAEWAIPQENAKDCIMALREWLREEHDNPRGLRPHFPLEIRWTDADDVWLSPSYGRKTCWIGMIQFKPYGFDVPWKELFDKFDKIMYSHGGRPHWAKTHSFGPPQLRESYPHFDEFVNLLKEIDPNGMFRTEYVNRHMYGLPAAGKTAVELYESLA
ncbi:gulonolactone oxidase Lgo1 [Dacryopinax primogenitus]|uniref:D-arabinono-1,4-lactone oxidase n=1 Tax=Dacryopinax primogenitus (strain DJM 731) TaxID=1858805 RepID=M5GCT0_DACPD|nr:gulonolactone oxidase Lgo1 [Dacryopinax primogenitus]EJU01953.1 gulonolactone oxidase Lgo1 [Dacryopinax primogenitus]